MAKVPLVLFPSRTSLKEVLQGFQAPQGAPQGENTKGTFVKGHLCAFLIHSLSTDIRIRTMLNLKSLQLLMIVCIRVCSCLRFFEVVLRV